MAKALEFKLHSSIHNRWKYWFSNDISKKEKGNLQEIYKHPPGLEIPKLNPQILLKLPKRSRLKSIYMAKRQQLSGASFTAIGLAMSTLMG